MFVVVIVKAYLSRDDAGQRSEVPGLAIGSKFALKDVDWAANGRTLVLALSKNCRFCLESAPLYQPLSQELRNRSDIHLLAIFPEPVTEAKIYLEQMGVFIDDVRQTSLVSLGFKGTPTMLLVDNTGHVTDYWFGKLTDFQTAQFIERAHLEHLTAGSAHEQEKQIDDEEIQRLIRSGQRISIVDVRDRQSYSADHVPNSINIPSDELQVRAINELSRTDLIVTSCQCADAVRTHEIDLN